MVLVCVFLEEAYSTHSVHAYSVKSQFPRLRGLEVEPDGTVNMGEWHGDSFC